MKITIGIAAYNVGHYLSACIESVLAARQDGVEIMIINDGSTDNSGQICNEYAKQYPDLTVIHKENGGISSVRNLMIEKASGDWICFVDGDDRLAPDAVKIMTEYADSEYDTIYFDKVDFTFDHSIPPYLTKAEPIELSGSEIETLFLDTLYTVTGARNYINTILRSVTSKLFKVSFLREHNLKFDERIIYAQDVLFVLRGLQKSRQIKMVRRPVYQYRQNPRSVVHRYNTRIRKNMAELSEALHKLGQDYGGDDIMERLRLRCVADFSGLLKLDLCHPNNPDGFAKRKAEFEEICRADWCRRAFEIKDKAMLTPNDRKSYTVFTSGDFKKICRYYKRKYRKEKLKRLINIIGLNKILKPIRAWLKERSR